MHSTLKEMHTDDPHDSLDFAPGIALLTPDDGIALLTPDEKPTHIESDFPVDATFRPAAVNELLGPGRPRLMGRPAVRGLTALLLTACIGGAAIAWHHNDTAKEMIAGLAPQLVPAASPPSEKPALSAQTAPPAAQVATANPAPPQPPPAAQPAPPSVAPAAATSPQSPQSQPTARDLASVRQEVEQLKASIEQLKASQQQIALEMAKTSEANKASEANASAQNPRPRISTPRTQSAAARSHRSTPPYPPTQAVAPYVPQQVEPQPQATAQPPADPELASVPRPPMPVRQ